MHYTKGDNSSTQSQSDIDFERCTCIYSDNGPAQQTWFCLINYSSKLIYIKLYTNTPRALPCTLCTTDFLLQYILNHSFHSSRTSPSLITNFSLSHQYLSHDFTQISIITLGTLNTWEIGATLDLNRSETTESMIPKYIQRNTQPSRGSIYYASRISDTTYPLQLL